MTDTASPCRFRVLGSRDLLGLLAIAAGWALLRFGLQGDLGLNWSDEGHLFYGIDRLGHGELPLRDFQAYDPGRYLWGRAWGTWFGQNALSWRAAGLAFWALGLFFALCVARRVERSWTFLLILAGGLTVWAFPRHKLFESALSLLLVWAVCRFFERVGRERNVRATFELGAIVGVVALFARNFALYGAVASLLAIAGWELRWRRGDQGPPLRPIPSASHRALAHRIGIWTAGGLVGYFPMLLACLLVPGLARGLWRSITTTLAYDAPSLPAPIPWPWRLVGAGPLPLWKLALSAAFVAAFSFLAFRLWRTWRDPIDSTRSRVAAAATLVALPCLHHVLARSDAAHLGQAIHPLLLAFVLVTGSVSRVARIATLTLVVGLGLAIYGPLHPLGALLLTPSEWRPVETTDSTLQAPTSAWTRYTEMRDLIRTHVPDDEVLWAGPFVPLLYVDTERSSPTWQIFAVQPAPERIQHRWIEELDAARTEWVLIDHFLWDGREEYAFERANPLAWGHVRDRFVPVASAPHQRATLFRRSLPDLNPQVAHREPATVRLPLVVGDPVRKTGVP